MAYSRYRCQVEYDGTDFCGWQWQPERRTVQSVLESALEKIFKEEIRVNGAGRTDTGVHAIGQIAHFDAPVRFDDQKLQLALNANLPRDVKLHDLRQANADFHARFTARWRWYRYRLFTRSRAVERQFGWFPKFNLDPEPLQQASRLLPGQHDFSAFSSVEAGGTDPKHGGNCLVYTAGWELLREEFRFHIVANRFLRRMVRGLVGTMMDVARGHFDLAYFTALLHGTQKSDLIFNAPAQGLCLMRVGYAQYPYIESNSEEVIEAHEIFH